MTNAIEIRNLTKKFGTKTAVKNISLDIPENSVFSLLGVNGAGKTTVIRILTGLSKATSGTAKVCGYYVNMDLQHIKKVSNISTQETAIAPNLTVKENLLFMAQIYGMNKEQAEKTLEKTVHEFSLEEVMDSKAKILSGGWQRKVSIAMATITNPKVLFLDEPTLGLDVLARRELWKLINKVKKNATIVLTTHYMEEAEELSDYVAVMVKGEIRDIGTVEALKQKFHAGSLEEAFIQIAGEDAS